MKVTANAELEILCTDSQVCLAVLVKGRTSARLLQPLVSRIAALLLAVDMSVAYVYVASDANPADPPSRWRPNA